MSQVINFIKLDFNRSNNVTIPTIEWDQGSRFVRVQLQNNNQSVDVTGSQVVITVIRNDLEEVIESCNILNAKDGLIEFEISKAMVARQGDMLCQLKLSDNDSLLSSQLFKVSVNNTLMVSLEESRSDMDVLIHALGEVQDIDNRFNKIDENYQKVNAQLSTKARQVDLEVERQRIDQLAQLQDGSTTGDAELIDGRIGILGQNYNNIGDAVREQLKNALNNNVTSKEFSLSEVFYEGTLSVPKELLKGQKIVVALDADEGVLDVTKNVVFGLSPIEGTSIQNVLFLKKGESGTIEIPKDCKSLNAWVANGVKLTAGKVTITMSYENNIYEEMTKLREEIRNATIVNQLEGKTFSIIGDSYSTYKNWIPTGYEAWYSNEGNVNTNDISSVKQCWWYLLSKDTKMSLITNSSYSGTTICNTGYGGVDASDKSFITRMKKDIGESQKINVKPDIIFVFGGTNDRWAGSPVGEVKYTGWTDDDLKKVLPAFCYMIDYLKLWNPHARIINIVNTELGQDITNGMQTICNHYEIENVVLSNISKESGHPNVEGMEQIKSQILNVLGTIG